MTHIIIKDGVITPTNLPNNFNNILSGYKERTDLHEVDGFFLLEKPSITIAQKYGSIIEENGKYSYSIIDLSQEEINYNNLKYNLKVYNSYSDYKLTNQLADYFSKKHSLSEVDEFNGRKLKSVYVNENQEIVAEKVFSLKEENNLSIEYVEIYYYTNSGEKVKGFEKGGVIDTSAKQKSITISCMKKVLEILLDDTILGEDDLFHVELKTEVEALERGNSILLYNKLGTSKNPLLDKLVPSTIKTSETYRKMLRSRFNPDNYNFYTVSKDSTKK